MHVDEYIQDFDSDIVEDVRKFWDKYDEIECLYKGDKVKQDFLIDTLIHTVNDATPEQQAPIMVEQLYRGRARMEKARQKSLRFIEDYHREMGTQVPGYWYLSEEGKNTWFFLRSNERRIARGENPRTLQEYIDDYERRTGIRMSTDSFEV
jgi:hypothetical protein